MRDTVGVVGLPVCLYLLERGVYGSLPVAYVVSHGKRKVYLLAVDAGPVLIEGDGTGIRFAFPGNTDVPVEPLEGNLLG